MTKNVAGEDVQGTNHQLPEAFAIVGTRSRDNVRHYQVASYRDVNGIMPTARVPVHFLDVGILER